MVKINYSDLKSGHILQPGDSLLIHGYEYYVTGETDCRYWLSCIGDSNAAVFRKLGRYDDRHKWAKTFDESVFEDSTALFPEFISREKLTKFVKAMYEIPSYRSGTRVRVKKRIGRDDDYPLFFADGMADLSGKEFTICDASFSYDTKDIENKKYYNGDLGEYHFKEDNGNWVWSSSMFEAIEEPGEKAQEYIPRLVTSEELAAGYILKHMDRVVLNGVEYKVVDQFDGDYYWMTPTDGSVKEDYIFTSLGYDRDEVEKWASSFGAFNTVPDFPEFESLDNLSQFVFDILLVVDRRKKAEDTVNHDNVTYKDLINGYILKANDTLTLAGDKYRFIDCLNGKFLVSDEVKWDTIFDKAGVEDKDGFCEKFGELSWRDCLFPEFKTAEGLTKCVIELMERAEHIPVSPEPFAVSMDYEQSEETTDTGKIRLPEIKDDFKIIL